MVQVVNRLALAIAVKNAVYRSLIFPQQYVIMPLFLCTLHFPLITRLRAIYVTTCTYLYWDCANTLSGSFSLCPSLPHTHAS